MYIVKIEQIISYLPLELPGRLIDLIFDIKFNSIYEFIIQNVIAFIILNFLFLLLGFLINKYLIKIKIEKNIFFYFYVPYLSAFLFSLLGGKLILKNILFIMLSSVLYYLICFLSYIFSGSFKIFIYLYMGYLILVFLFFLIKKLLIKK